MSSSPALQEILDPCRDRVPNEHGHHACLSKRVLRPISEGARAGQTIGTSVPAAALQRPLNPCDTNTDGGK